MDFIFIFSTEVLRLSKKSLEATSVAGKEKTMEFEIKRIEKIVQFRSKRLFIFILNLFLKCCLNIIVKSLQLIFQQEIIYVFESVSSGGFITDSCYAMRKDTL